MEEVTRTVGVNSERKQTVMYITISVLGTLVVMLVLAFIFFDLSPRAKQSAVATVPAQAVPAQSAPVQPAPAAPRGPTVEISDVSGNDPTIVDVVRKVAEHLFLPKGKVIVGTVVDPEASRKINPIFYANTKQGYKVLIYDDRAILYDPTIDRLLNMWHFVQNVNNNI